MLNQWAMMGNNDLYITLKNGGYPVLKNIAGWDLPLHGWRFEWKLIYG
jgi:hypothetical protein